VDEEPRRRGFLQQLAVRVRERPRHAGCRRRRLTPVRLTDRPPRPPRTSGAPWGCGGRPAQPSRAQSGRRTAKHRAPAEAVTTALHAPQEAAALAWHRAATL